MLAAMIFALLALTAAVLIVVSATRRHQAETGVTTTWRDVREAFSGGAISGVRREAEMLSEPTARETDLGVADLGKLSEEGSGYVMPRDILARRTGRR